MIQTRLYDYNTCSCEICNVQTAETLLASAGVLTRVPWQCSHANPATHWLELEGIPYTLHTARALCIKLSLSLSTCKLLHIWMIGYTCTIVQLTRYIYICYMLLYVFYVSGRTIIIMWRNKNEKKNNTLFQSVINIVKKQNIGKTQKKISR